VLLMQKLEKMECFGYLSSSKWDHLVREGY
jgi:hypothetical protein